MDIEKLAKDSILKIKNKYELPDTGILAGGSLANLVWESVSSKTAIINDIDIFHFQGLIKHINPQKKVFYSSFEKVLTDSYWGVHESLRENNFYVIDYTETKGIINSIFYKATTDDPTIVIESFDLNCTQIGWDIESDKIFWTAEFEEFLKTGEIKLTHIESPNHTALRLFKKRDELGAKLDKLEIKILAYVCARNWFPIFDPKHHIQPIFGVVRKYFSDKYYKLFLKYQKEITPFFRIEEENGIKQIIKEYSGDDVNIWTLKPIKHYFQIFSRDNKNGQIIDKIAFTNDLLYFFRNIIGHESKTKIWSELSMFFTIKNYIDCIPEDKDLLLLKNIIKYAPRTSIKLKNFKLSEQLKLVKNISESFKDDLNVGLTILESQDLAPDTIFDKDTKLLLELKVRKKILKNNYQTDKINNF